jgi:hypothetical protein
MSVAVATALPTNAVASMVETKALLRAPELPRGPVNEVAVTVVKSAELGAAEPSGNGLANMVVMFAGHSTLDVLLAA